MLIYLAAPIDYNTIDPQKWPPLREVLVDPQKWPPLREMLVDAGMTVYSPGRAWSTKAEPIPDLQAINLEVVRRCDGLLAWLPRGVLTVGTVLELNAASEWNIPASVIGDPGWALSYLGIPAFPAADEAINDLIRRLNDV
jgi:hypothetical protein